MIYLVGAVTIGLGIGYNCIFAKRKPTACEHTVKEVAKCVFCVSNERGKAIVESQKIAEGRHMRLLIDNSPIINGHLLLTTVANKKKAHELSDPEVLQEHRLLKQVASMLKTQYQASSYFQLQKNGKRAGESVPHYHKHIFPIASKEMFEKAKRNFALKFVTAQFGCAAKLQGEKLATLKSTISKNVTIEELEENGAEKKKDKEEEKEKAPAAQMQAYERPIEPGHVVITTTNKAVKFAHERTDEEVLACHHLLQTAVRTFQSVYDTCDYVQIEENADSFVQKESASAAFRMHLYPVPRVGHEFYRQTMALIRYNYDVAKTI